MINFVSKLIALFIHPLGWIALLLLTALFVRSRRVRRGCLWSALAVFLVFSNPALFDAASDAWCADQMVPWPAAGRHYTYCFIPGGMTEGYDRQYRTVGYREAVDRMHTAVLFVKEGICDTILISGDGGSTHDVGDPAGFADHAARLFGIDPSCIKIEQDALTTMQNFQYSIPMMQHGTCITVNSALYMPRTRLCARLQHFDTDFFAVQYIADPAPGHFRFVQLLPDWNTLNDWHRKLLHEWFGYLWYLCLY